ncbi:unnamed protein product [Tilletia laevis]|uniref:Uncharacterized protein n=3 Tax=Tilletia TaxID=13289 RepID=A0A8X7MQG4_9BASI|nr:hypothetical protein A4X06_0g5921 [Tilletia controversa]CAD6888429.1 unnamed protein product [Tilletia caries]CAD6962262.1 unnamed protein product [Tilletia laevis]CAD6899075.1 unnamed protein product [Tilletia controversa]CAD6900331.1 unnamed protein product [Tilletia controversa]
MANNNDSIFNCTFSGEIQVDSIEKEGQNKYNNLKVTFPLGLEPDLDIDAKATAFGVQSAEPPIVANITAGFTTGATPKLTIQRYTHLYDAESEPPDYTIPCPKISGVGRVTHIDEANKAIQFVTAAWCRETGTKRTQEMIGWKLPEIRYKNSPYPPVGALLYYAGELYSQQASSGMFTIMLDDFTWSAAAGSGAATNSDGSNKRRRLGRGNGKKQTKTNEIAANQATTSGSSTTEAR